MAQEREVKYTYISELDELYELSASDLFVVSHLSDEVDQKYDSCKLQYSTLREDLFGYVSSYMTSLTDMELSAGVDKLSSVVEDLSSVVEICISAIVALDNCRTGVKARVADLEQRVAALEQKVG